MSYQLLSSGSLKLEIEWSEINEQPEAAQHEE